MSTVYMFREQGETVPMSRIRCQDEDRELQLILERNHDLLPGDQIDPDDPRRWLLLKREMAVPDPSTGTDRWSVDFLFADQDGMPTFVECKRCADTRSRREIVGQMLEYAANGHHYWNRDHLKAIAEKTAKASGCTVDQSLDRLRPTGSLSVDEYFEVVEENLREGRLRIIFFLEDSAPELRSVVDFLNRQMKDSEILLVEARQYAHSDSRIVVPTLFGYTEAARLLKRSSTPAGTRRRWDRTSYFADAAEKLSSEQALAVETLLDQSLALGCQVSWGTGARNGSFNVKEPTACQRSLLTCWSNGDLSFNFHWLNGTDAAERAQRRLRELIVERLQFPAGMEGRDIGIDFWWQKADVLAGVLRQLVAECRNGAPA